MIKKQARPSRRASGDRGQGLPGLPRGQVLRRRPGGTRPSQGPRLRARSYRGDLSGVSLGSPEFCGREWVETTVWDDGERSGNAFTVTATLRVSTPEQVAKSETGNSRDRDTRGSKTRKRIKAATSPTSAPSDTTTVL